jgi:hypothetical protein
MEYAAQQLAKRVRITPPKNKRIADLNWQNLHDQVTKKIQSRARKTAKQKELNRLLSEASNHLWNVKEAYRNRSAHAKGPKNENFEDQESKLTYILLQQTEIFLTHFAKHF